MKIFILFGIFFACHAFMMMQCSAKAFIGNWLSGVFGESMHRYRYDLDSGTSYYRNTDGTVDSWQSPQRRDFRHNSYRIENEKGKKSTSTLPRKHLEFYTNLFLR